MLLLKKDIIYNISNFDENIFEYIIWLKSQEGKKRNKDNKEKSQKLSQEERACNKWFLRNKRELSNIKCTSLSGGIFINGVERLYLKGIEIMDEKIEIKKQDFYEMMYLMEKILYIAERSGAREDSDNNAYSLAITFGKENVVQELLSLRRKMNHYLDDQGEAELEKVLEPIDDITIPYGLTLEALRKELEPYLPKRIEG